ncbi:hypothetical protein ACLH0B_17720 [Aeromonas salmonicida]|uniref:hypothetical protein n=1 Tax=Aeromonas salmonicida TaxID=645 RepID=UPI003D03FCE0
MTMRELIEGFQDALWFLAGRLMEGVAMGLIIACLIGSPDTFLGVWIIIGAMFAMFGRYWMG